MKKNWLIIILVLASLLRFYGLGRGDTMNDEVYYAFRGLGMVDFDEGKYQTTPLEWFNPQVPWWTSLSFHDHPPLVFAVQHFFLKIFGDNNAAFRLPSVILGALSVYLIYLLGKKLFSKKAGLWSAGIYAVTLNGVYISRTGLQEPYVIFFFLLVSFLFLKALEKNKYFIWTGLVIGLGGLAKYNFFIAVPILLLYLLLFRRRTFRLKEFWLGLLLAVLIFSPVIVYNIQLYRAVGHFDFQLSYMLGQNHPEWQVQPGKEVGSLSDRLNNFLPRMIASNSWVFLLLALISMFAFIFKFIKKNKEKLPEKTFLTFWLVFLFALIMLVGPSYRFLTMLTPFLALAIGFFLSQVSEKLRPSVEAIEERRRRNTERANANVGSTEFSRTNVKKYLGWAGLTPLEKRNLRFLPTCLWQVGFLTGLIVFAGFEIFYSYNNQLAYYPIGTTPWFSSKVRYENYNWGYNELDDYLRKEFAGKMPLLTFDVKYQFLENLRQKALQEGLAAGLTREPFLIVYGGNFDDGPKLWVMERRMMYKAWPILRLDDYYKYLAEQGAGYFDRAGFRQQYFIYSANSVPDEKFRRLVSGLNPVPIKNPRGDIVFMVYKIDNSH